MVAAPWATPAPAYSVAIACSQVGAGRAAAGELVEQPLVGLRGVEAAGGGEVAVRDRAQVGAEDGLDGGPVRGGPVARRRGGDRGDRCGRCSAGRHGRRRRRRADRRRGHRCRPSGRRSGRGRGRARRRRGVRPAAHEDGAARRGGERGAGTGRPRRKRRGRIAGHGTQPGTARRADAQLSGSAMRPPPGGRPPAVADPCGGSRWPRGPELSGVRPTVCGVTGTVGAPTPTPAEGAAGPDEVPRRPALSPSRAADFTLCPLLYRFRAIDRLPEAPGPAQVRGTLVHAVLERLFDLPAAERLPGAARALVAPAWADLCAAEPGLPAALFGEGAAGAAGTRARRRRGGGDRPLPRPRRGLAGRRRSPARRLLRARGSAAARAAGPGAAGGGRAGVGAAAARLRRPDRRRRGRLPRRRLQDRHRSGARGRGPGAVPDEVLRAGAAAPARLRAPASCA